MEMHKGVLNKISSWVGYPGGGGKYDFIQIGDQVLRKISCPSDVANMISLSVSNEVTLYTVKLPFFLGGRGIVAIKTEGQPKFSMSSGQAATTVLFLFMATALLLFFPALYVGFMIGSYKLALAGMCFVVPGWMAFRLNKDITAVIAAP